MAISIHTGGHHTLPRPPWMRRQPPSHDTLLATLMVAIIVTGIAALMPSAPTVPVSLPRLPVGTTWRSIEARPRDGAAPAASHAPSAVAEEDAVEPPPTAPESAPPSSGPQAPDLIVGERARVVNTNGAGVILHTAPRPGARRPAGLLEGTLVSVVELADGGWARVRSDAQQSGWVPTEFLTVANGQ